MQQEEDNKELKLSAPQLFSIPKEDPFVRDEAFFHAFPHQVQHAIAQKGSEGWTEWWKPALVGGIPAALLLTAIIIFMSAPEPTAPKVIATQEIYEVTLDDLEIADSDLDFYAYVKDIGGASFDRVTVDLSEEEMQAYVNEEDIDLIQMINEL